MRIKLYQNWNHYCSDIIKNKNNYLWYNENANRSNIPNKELLVDKCEKNLDLCITTLSDEYYYTSFPLCLIDAIFNFGVRYAGTRNVVIRYCEKV